ncbi:hypothetical protein GMOD_00010046 [Pyrenophora seminiperda CCB06]|uniref:Uncharacterized protein n=1 Tax=Pyrenophora seminiperda CCB06 TaxID=1302712 RepID=A0A3M7M1S0_9PLEO|nr:hypothetical protein GMOD_00010046 [Pyrenophora seminiperda CCB06]
MVFGYESRGRSTASREQPSSSSFYMDAARRDSGSARPGYQSTYDSSRASSSRYESTQPSVRRTNTTASDRSIHGHGLNTRDLSPMRNSTQPRRNPLVWQDRPVSPLGTILLVVVARCRLARMNVLLRHHTHLLLRLRRHPATKLRLRLIARAVHTDNPMALVYNDATLFGVLAPAEGMSPALVWSPTFDLVGSNPLTITSTITSTISTIKSSNTHTMYSDYTSRGRASSRRQESEGSSSSGYSSSGYPSSRYLDGSRSGYGSARPSYQPAYATADYGRPSTQSSSYDYVSPFVRRSNTTASDRSVYDHGLSTRDLSPMRESTRPRRNPMVWDDRPVSPIGTSRFERPSEYTGRRVRATSFGASSNAYGSSSYERPSTSSGHSFQVDRGYDGAFAVNRGYDGMTNGFPEGPGLSRRNAVRRPGDRSNSHGAYEPRPHMEANFRSGGFGDWERF